MEQHFLRLPGQTKLWFFAFFIVFLCFSERVRAQNISQTSDGKDFYIGFIHPSYNKVANPNVGGFFSASALITSYTNTTVKVSYFDLVTGAELVDKIYKI